MKFDIPSWIGRESPTFIVARTEECKSEDILPSIEKLRTPISQILIQHGREGTTEDVDRFIKYLARDLVDLPTTVKLGRWLAASVTLLDRNMIDHFLYEYGDKIRGKNFKMQRSKEPWM